MGGTFNFVEDSEKYYFWINRMHMVDDQIGIQLHQKSFKGEKLTEFEQKQLQIWYAQRDRAEASKLNSEATISTTEQIRVQITDMLNRITQITQHIQAIAQENDSIRQENQKLFQLLAQKSKAA